MKENKGFTLIELIICIAIAAVLLGGVYINTNLLVYADTKSCAEKIDNTLSGLRLDTMSKGSSKHYLIIEWNDTDSSYYMNAAVSDETLDISNWKTKADTIKTRKIADRNITIDYTDQPDGTNKQTLDDTNPCILISFYSGSGAFESGVRQIIISSRADTSTIHMVTTTGKHYVE